MKRCRSCGAANGDESNFCQRCGARLDNQKPSGSSDRNLIVRFMEASIFLKLIVIVVGVFVFLLVTAWAAHLFLGMPLESFTDGERTSHQSEFDSLDIDGDGALSFYEVQGVAWDLSYDNHMDIFDGADKSGDGVLKGAEFDGYLYLLEKHYEDLEKQQKPKQQKSSSSSHSNPYFEDEGHESCPICGSEDLSEVPNGWYCNDCGEYLDDDDLYLNWWESQGITCTLPFMESAGAIV